jgi:hypothetical protein
LQLSQLSELMAAVYLPATQERQFELANWSLYFPAKQAEHDEEPEPEYFPFGQSSQSSKVAVLIFPEAQFVQMEAPAPAYFPASHTLQSAMSAERYFPAMHFSQEVYKPATAKETSPGGHDLHSSKPFSLYVPLGHS